MAATGCPVLIEIVYWGVGRGSSADAGASMTDCRERLGYPSSECNRHANGGYMNIGGWLTQRVNRKGGHRLPGFDRDCMPGRGVGIKCGRWRVHDGLPRKARLSILRMRPACNRQAIDGYTNNGGWLTRRVNRHGGHRLPVYFPHAHKNARQAGRFYW